MTLGPRAGRGRLLAALAAMLMMISCPLPWYRFVGQAGEAVLTGFDGSGILVFLAGIATLAVIALPHATGDWASGLDRWIVFALFAGAAFLGIAIWPIEFVVAGEWRGLAPDRALGPWVALAGALTLAWATLGIARQPASSRAGRS
jgi:hypothetical protein